MFLKLAESFDLISQSLFSNKKVGSTSSLFELLAFKAKIKGVLTAGSAVAVVTCYVNKIIVTRLTKDRHLFATRFYGGGTDQSM